MQLQEIKDIVSNNSGTLAIILLLALSLVEVSKIKINPWTWIAKKVGPAIGKAINGEVVNKIDAMKKEFDDLKADFCAMKEKSDEREASNCRTHILRFGDDLLHGVRHSKEHFNHVLLAISTYEQYCDTHPNYLNNVACATIEHIKKTYQKCLDDNDFL